MEFMDPMDLSALLPASIEKEEVALLCFPITDVLFNSEDIRARTIDLHYAVKLGNLDRYKVKIIFEDDRKLRRIETTIWETTKKMAVLKMGIQIPIHRIWEIKFL